jgi:hypothetical protein
VNLSIHPGLALGVAKEGVDLMAIDLLANALANRCLMHYNVMHDEDRSV